MGGWTGGVRDADDGRTQQREEREGRDAGASSAPSQHRSGQLEPPSSTYRPSAPLRAEKKCISCSTSEEDSRRGGTENGERRGCLPDTIGNTEGEPQRRLALAGDPKEGRGRPLAHWLEAAAERQAAPGGSERGRERARDRSGPRAGRGKACAIWEKRGSARDLESVAGDRQLRKRVRWLARNARRLCGLFGLSCSETEQTLSQTGPMIGY